LPGIQHRWLVFAKSLFDAGEGEQGHDRILEGAGANQPRPGPSRFIEFT